MFNGARAGLSTRVELAERARFIGWENSPFQALIKEISQAAFVAHPYHHSTIGHRSDIEKVSIEKLQEFYDTYYWPDNATVSIIARSMAGGTFRRASSSTETRS